MLIVMLESLPMSINRLVTHLPNKGEIPPFPAFLDLLFCSGKWTRKRMNKRICGNLLLGVFFVCRIKIDNSHKLYD